METWHRTYDTKEAAVFAHLGATVKIWSSVFEKSGERRVRFDVSPMAGAHHVGKIRAAVKSRRLPAETPAHPFLTGLRACHARRVLLEHLKRGSFFRQSAVTGAPGVFELVPSTSIHRAAADHRSAARTPDIDMAAALLTAGFPLLSITGSAPAHLFTFATHPLPGAPPLDAPTLIRDWRKRPDNMPADLTFTIAAGSLASLATLHREVRNVIDTILISKPRSASHVAIRIDAAPRAWDTAKRFLAGQ